MKANISNIHKELNTNLLHPPYETLGTAREKIMDKVGLFWGFCLFFKTTTKDNCKN